MLIISGILHFYLARYLYLSAKSAFVNVSLHLPERLLVDVDYTLLE